jgi:hypothetical protein
MSNYTTGFTAQDAAYKEIWDIAQDAFYTLKTAGAGGYVDNSPADPADMQTLATLEFDPGAPKLISINAGPIGLDAILSNVDEWISRIESIQAPVFPTNNTQMEDHQMWSDSFAEQIKSSLSDYITSMGIPDITYQNAIFNEDFERNLVILNDLYDLADAKTGARGFTYTNAYGNALKLDAQVKYQYDRTQVSRTISKTLTEWARQNYQFAIQNGITLEQAHMDFTYKFCTASVEIYKTLVNAILEKYKAEIQVALAPAEAYIKEMDAVLNYVKTSADIDKTNETLKQSRSEIDIKEAIGKYNIDMSKYQADATMAASKLGQRLQCLREIANHTANIAGATSNSSINLAKG